MTTNRATRRLVGVLGAAALLFTIGSSAATAAPAVVLTKFMGGLDRPVFVTSARDGTGRTFVVEKGGKVRVIKNGVLLAKPFLDISDQVAKGSEQGLLGLAFHPSYKKNGYVYVNFTRNDGDTAINRYHVSSSNPDVAVRSTARRIITIAQPYDNHNGGSIAFGRDGYMYIGTGDGGSGGDPGNRAQRTDTLLGKMLRINVNGSVGKRHYLNPSSNPWVGKPGLNEIWARGLRNPWKFSFDRATGDLWIGDVGQNTYEEIDRSTRASGGGKGKNYGWRTMEGRHCYSPKTGCNKSGKTLPVVEYSHADGGCSVTGGYVYRGAEIASLKGRYLFADFCSGKIWTVPNGGTSPMTKQLLLDTDFMISSFGESARGEIYVVDHGGTIYRLKAG